MAKTSTKTSTVAKTIYASIAAKHPDWTQARVYAVTKSILQSRSKKEAKAAAKAEA